MRRLILMRHGDAEANGPQGKGDRGRALSREGLGSALRLGQELRARGLSPDYILCSDATRAVQTLEGVVRGGGFTGVPTSTLAFLYLADPETLLGRCHEVADTVQTLLCIGHNPGWSDAATLLSGNPVGLDTAEAAILEKSGESWSQALTDGGLWRLKGIVP